MNGLLCLIKNMKQNTIGAIVGMVLGDAHIHKRDMVLCITHSIKQKEYLSFKRDILQQRQERLIKISEYSDRGYSLCRISTTRKPIYRILRKKFYKNGVKTVSTKLLNKLTPLGIAIWFMDDGCTVYKKRQNGKIHSVEIILNTYLSKEQNEIIIKYFLDKWGLKFGLNRCGKKFSEKGIYRLRMGAKEGRKLMKLIGHYFVDCMKYKSNKLQHKGEYPL